jgi:large subunit ribosomal protein L10
MPSKQNIERVSALKDKLAENSSLIFVDYRGISAENIKALRKELNKSDTTINIVKNTLFKIAMKDSGFPEIEAAVVDPTAVVFSKDDITLSAKTIRDAAKKSATLTIKGGIMDGVVLSPEQVMKVADLPPKEILLSQLVGAVQGPISGFVFSCKGIINNLVYTLSAVKDKKSEAA